MKRIEIKEFDSEWIDDEYLALWMCPVCKYRHNENLLVSVYEDSACACSNCGSKFVISQTIKLFKLEKE